MKVSLTFKLVHCSLFTAGVVAESVSVCGMGTLAHAADKISPVDKSSRQQQTTDVPAGP